MSPSGRAWRRLRPLRAVAADVAVPEAQEVAVAAVSAEALLPFR